MRFDYEAMSKVTPTWAVSLRYVRQRAGMLGGSVRVDSGPATGTGAELRVLFERRPQRTNEGSP